MYRGKGTDYSPAPQQTKDQLSYPSHLFRKGTITGTHRKDCNTQYVLQRAEKACTHQERDTG